MAQPTTKYIWENQHLEVSLKSLWTARGLISSLSHKLRMFGIPLDRLGQVVCSNHGTVKDVSLSESVLLKKHNAINIYQSYEAAVRATLQVFKEDTKTNLADLFSEVLLLPRQHDLLGSMLYNFWQITLGFHLRTSCKLKTCFYSLQQVSDLKTSMISCM